MRKGAQPPKIYTRLFEWFCEEEYYEELQGDLEQSFYENIKAHGEYKAIRKYRKEVFLMVRPSVIRKIKGHTNSNNLDMVHNYLKIGVRNMLSQRLYSFINIFGLAVGMAATILISLYVQHELSYDKYHEKADRIYRISREWLNQDGESSLHLGHIAPPFAPLIENDFEGVVEQAVRLMSGYGPLMSVGDKQFEEENFFFADADVFKVFSWKFIQGNRETALVEPNTLVLSETVTKRYFNDEDPIGKSLTFNNFGIIQEMKITGVIEDTPDNSHFKYGRLCSFLTYENVVGTEQLMQRFGSNNFATYVLFPEGVSASQLEAGIPAFTDKHLGQNGNGDPASTTNKLHLMPLTDIHLHSHLDSEIEANGDIKYVYTYIIIALFILVIACINFMNLSTARSMKRAKEVGVRKVMGAFRSSLIRQFITESVLMALISALLAIGFVALVLPWFNNFAGKELSLVTVDPLFFGGLLLIVVLSVGLLAGSYPAFFLSSFTPVKVLKGAKHSSHKKVNLRSVLVVFQFFISITLIICTLLVYQQLEYTRTKNLGFEKENMIIIDGAWRLDEGKQEALRQDLASQSSIIDASISNNVPPGVNNTTIFRKKGEEQDILVSTYNVDYNHLPTMKIELLEGRNLSRDFPTDTAAVLLNEAAVREFGLDDPLSEEIRYFGGGEYGSHLDLKVVGVFKDFNFETLRNNIRPLALMLTTQGSKISVRTAPGDVSATLATVEDLWGQYASEEPFQYSFLDEDFDALFRSEQRLGQVFSVFTGLAILVACLGLLGLAAFMAEQRTKEIGIRKVLGASVASVVLLMSKDFTKLVLIAFALAIPLAYYIMHSWLKGFAFRITISPSIFVLAGVSALLIAWLTVSWQSIKAASANPVKSLRSE